MGTTCSKCFQDKGKRYAKRNEGKNKNPEAGIGQKKGTGKHPRHPVKGAAGKRKGLGHPQQPVADESNINYAINRGSTADSNKETKENMAENHYVKPEINQNGGGLENKDKEKQKRKRGRKTRRYFDSSDSSSSSTSSSSSSDDGGGQTTRSKQKKVNKDGSVTYISNKTTIGSSKISFKAAKNINIYNNKNTYTTVQSNPEKIRELFKKEYTEKTAETEERELCSIFKGQQPIRGQFVDLRGRDNVQTAFDTGVLSDCAGWVGQIKFPQGSCTCFRVGTKYIMTALHAIKHIIETYDDYVPVQESHEQDELSRVSVLSEYNVFVDFNFLLTDRPSPERNKFYFKHINTPYEIPFLDAETDVIVLELDARPGQFLPLQFTKFGIPKLDKAFHLITHSNGNPKEIDKVTKIVDINNPQTVDDINFLKAESRRYLDANGRNPDIHVCETRPHNILANHSRLLFHCASNKGASGSPGVQVTASGQVVVVTMLIHGYPDWYYDEDCEQLTANWNKEYTIEQGVNFASVYSQMRTQNRVLCDEIFPAHGQPERSSVNNIHVVQPTDEN